MAQQKNIKVVRDEVRAEIRAVYPTAFSLNRRQTGELISASEGHLANLESGEDTQPLVTPRKQGRRVVYHVIDIIDYLVSQRLDEEKKRRGPRTKVERIEGGSI